MRVKRVGEIKDPVHGYIYFTEEERALIDSRPLQRLRRIKQLAGSELTYPGASHTRFLHSLGVMHLAGLLAGRLHELGHIGGDDIAKLRIAGLLHDVGHGPFSHVYEEVLFEHRGLTHEDLTHMVVQESELGDLLGDMGYSKREIADLCVGRLSDKDRSFLNQVMTGRLSPDTMDYIVRDSYFAGVGFGAVDIHRLIDSIDLVDGSIAVDYPGAFYVLEAFIIARLELFNAVYFHRTVRAANVMLSRAMSYADEELGLTRFNRVEEFLSLDDHTAIMRILSLEGGDRAKVARRLAEMFMERRLLKSTYEATVHRGEGPLANVLRRPSLRRKLEEEISARAGVDPDYVIIDVPTVLSVPVHPKDGGEILVFRRGQGGKEVFRLTEVSQLLASLSKLTDIVRVYTIQEWREPVERACREVLGEAGLSRVSV